MRSIMLALCVVVLASCDKPAATTTASSWTLHVTSNGVLLGTTPIKVTFLQDAQPVGSAEGSTDVHGDITMPVLITAGRADRAKVEVLRQEPVEVAFGAKVVDVGPLVGLDVPEAPRAKQQPAGGPTSWTVKLTSKGAPLANSKVSVRFMQSVQCIAAPCPSQLVGSVETTTDASGNASLSIPGGGLTNSPLQAELTVDGHAMVSAGIGAATVDVP